MITLIAAATYKATPRPAAEAMEAGVFFDGQVPPAFHAGQFWAGVCLKTKPPRGQRAGETFVDKIDANDHDWILSVRVSGIATEEGRKAAMEPLQKHFRMFLRDELGAVDEEDFADVFTSEWSDDEPSEARPHDSARVHSFVTSTDEGARRVQEMLAPKQETEEDVNVPQDVKQRMILDFARGYRKHLLEHGLKIAGYAFTPDADVMYTERSGVGWFAMLPAPSAKDSVALP